MVNKTKASKETGGRISIYLGIEMSLFTSFSSPS
jgi:hypothetical protein